MDTLALILALKGLAGGGGGGATIVPTLPTEDIKDGMIYILSTDWSMHIHDENGWHDLGGVTDLWEAHISDGTIQDYKFIRG